MSQADPYSRRVSFASTTTISPKSSASGSALSQLVTAHSANSANTHADLSRTRSESIMSNRPKSMTDFTALMDASMPLFESRTNARRSTSPDRKSPERGERAAGSRKKPSMSLAQGLIINGELHPPKSPYRQTHSRGSQDGGSSGAENGEESLFYAYALKVCSLLVWIQTLLNKYDRATMPTRLRTSSPSQPWTSAHIGGRSYSRSTLNLHAPALSSSCSRRTICRRYKTTPSSSCCEISGSLPRKTARTARLQSFPYKVRLGISSHAHLYHRHSRLWRSQHAPQSTSWLRSWSG